MALILVATAGCTAERTYYADGERSDLVEILHCDTYYVGSKRSACTNLFCGSDASQNNPAMSRTAPITTATVRGVQKEVLASAMIEK